MASPNSAARSRARGPKAPLSREAVVQAALDCLRAGGPGGLTMRKVAARLETGPGSLYAHIRDQRELYVAVLDQIIATVPGPPPGGSWEDRLVRLLRNYAVTLMDYPGAARLAMQQPATGPGAMQFQDQVLGLLLAGGLSDRVAAWSLDFVILLVTASTAEQDAQAAERPGESIAQSFAAAVGAGQGDLPNLRRVQEEIFAGTGEERLEWAIRSFLAGARAPA